MGFTSIPKLFLGSYSSPRIFNTLFKLIQKDPAYSDAFPERIKDPNINTDLNRTFGD